MKAILQALLMAVVCVLFGAAPANAGLIHSTTPDSMYLDYADLYPEVGWVGRLNQNGSTIFEGSGVLINPHWVLTAAHVVLETNNDPTSFFDGYRVGFTDNFFQNPGENVFASAVYVHPDYNDSRSGPDLALLFFEDAFSIDPTDLYAGPITQGSFTIWSDSADQERLVQVFRPWMEIAEQGQMRLLRQLPSAVSSCRRALSDPGSRRVNS